MNEQLPYIWKNISNANDDINDIADNKSNEPTKDPTAEAKSFFEKKEWGKAIESFLKALKKDTNNLEIHYFLGLLYTRTNDLNKALMHLSELTKSKHKYIETHNINSVLAYIYTMQKDFHSAFEYANKSIEHNARDINALSIKAFIYYKKGNYEKATSLYESILKIDKDNANAYNSLGSIKIEENKKDSDLDKGIELCKKALELSPNNPAYLDSIGWAYYKNKDDKKAIEYLKQAFENAPDNEEIKSHLKALLSI